MQRNKTPLNPKTWTILKKFSGKQEEQDSGSKENKTRSGARPDWWQMNRWTALLILLLGKGWSFDCETRHGHEGADFPILASILPPSGTAVIPWAFIALITLRLGMGLEGRQSLVLGWRTVGWRPPRERPCCPKIGPCTSLSSGPWPGVLGSA